MIKVIGDEKWEMAEMKKYFVASAETEWIDFLKKQYDNQKLPQCINYWSVRSDRFRALDEGDLFIFKRHRNKAKGENGEIVGGGYFCRYESISIEEAWDKYNIGNGVDTQEELLEALTKAEKEKLNKNHKIGCVILKDVFFLNPTIEEPKNWTSAQKGNLLHTIYHEVNKQLERGLKSNNVASDSSKKFSKNRIIFGAPGTGKSFLLNEDRKVLLGEENEKDYERVTFHPDYSYASFVGTYKPVMVKNADGRKEISYEFTPGPFLRVLVKALKNAITNEAKLYLLIIEEINRANVAAVFGDVFQLLDRDADGVSEFAIATSEDLRVYLAKELGVDECEVESIKLPGNMFIWATMNSADQGVYPMDTAFKRRWEFEYLSIDAKEEAIVDWQFKDARSDAMYSWNNLRKAINDKLIELKVNEDKLLGPFFLKKTDFDSYDKFKAVFSSKVLMYLFEDAARHRRSELFKGCGDKDCNIFSRICDKFGEQGVEIFHPDISNKFPVAKPVEQEE